MKINKISKIMKKLTAVIFTVALLITNVIAVIANETDEVPADDGKDIMIIIDKSTSMGWNDPEGETLSATNNILNISLGTNNRVGFVVYNDTIIAYQGLAVIETSEQIDDIMSELHELQRSRWTDAGLALQTARRLLNESEYRQGRTAIVYLSDGVSRFTMDHPHRDHDDVAIDVDNVFGSITYPVFMVEYTVLDDNPQNFGNGWGERTGGADFVATNPNEMIEVVDAIYRLITIMALGDETEPVGVVTGVYEHQLMIPIPQSDTERAEIVEVTLKGEGLLQEVIIPAAYDHVTVSVVGTNYVITVTDPLLSSYTIHYFSASEVPFENSTVTRMVEIRARQMPWEMVGWEMVGLVVSGIVVLIVLALLVGRLMKKRQLKKLYPTLNGTLECYFMEIPTGVKDIPVQSWSASFLAGNKKSLHKMLRNVPLRSKMPEAQKVFASINADSTISINNKAGVVCYKNGREVKANKDITLRSGEGLYMVFQKNTIELELRVSKSSLR